MKRCLASVALLAGALSVVSATQQPEQQPVFRGSRDTVRVFATVTDRDGRLATNLKQEDFEVRDEGKPQPITQFDNTPQPIRLIVMLDVSGSMEGNAPLLRAAGSQLIGRLLKDDVARIGSFGHDVTISPSFTSDPRELNAALPATIAPDAPTPLWRAVDQAMGAFGEEDDRRKVILVLSDGKDSGPTSFRAAAIEPGRCHRPRAPRGRDDLRDRHAQPQPKPTDGSWGPGTRRLAGHARRRSARPRHRARRG